MEKATNINEGKINYKVSGIDEGKMGSVQSTCAEYTLHKNLVNPEILNILSLCTKCKGKVYGKIVWELIREKSLEIPNGKRCIRLNFRDQESVTEFLDEWKKLVPHKIRISGENYMYFNGSLFVVVKPFVNPNLVVDIEKVHLQCYLEGDICRFVLTDIIDSRYKNLIGKILRSEYDILGDNTNIDFESIFEYDNKPLTRHNIGRIKEGEMISVV